MTMRLPTCYFENSIIQENGFDSHFVMHVDKCLKIYVNVVMSKFFVLV